MNDAALKYLARNPPEERQPDQAAEEYVARLANEAYGFRRTAMTNWDIECENEHVRFQVPDNQDACVQTRLPLFVPNDAKYLDDNELFYYYEVMIVSVGNSTSIAIGLATDQYPSYRLPGWNIHSVGYHSDDGRKYLDDSKGGQTYGPPYGKGDTVGVAYWPKSGFVIFCLNGRQLGVAFTGTRHVWHPTVGADGECTLRVNFGRYPFKNTSLFDGARSVYGLAFTKSPPPQASSSVAGYALQTTSDEKNDLPAYTTNSG